MFCNVKYGIQYRDFKCETLSLKDRANINLICNEIIPWFKLPFSAQLIPDNDKQNPNQNDKITMHVSCFCVLNIFVACFEITSYVQMSVDNNTSVVLCILFQT